MMHLQDLFPQDEDSQQLPSFSSEAKLTYAPQLKQFEDQQNQTPERDFFFDHPEQQPHSSTFSLTGMKEECQNEPTDEVQVQALKTRGRAKKINKCRNQTKNIPKNFGKGIISFIEQNKCKLCPFLESEGCNYEQLLLELRAIKRQINTIAELRELWTGQNGHCLRIISNLFFRKYALEYIFNSRISSFNSHIKYRASLWQAIKEPHSFNRIKEY